MPTLRDYVGQPLHWKRPRLLTRNYELFAGNQLLATLTRSGVFKERTCAHIDEEQWTFTRVGASRRRIVIYSGHFPDQLPAANDPEAVLASIQRNWRGNGELLFGDGRSYTWTHTGNWRPTWFWTDASSTPLLSLKRNRTMEISPEASDVPELALLTLLGVYLMVVMAEDAAASSAS